MTTTKGIWNDFKLQMYSGGVITWFIVVNVAIFVLLNIIMLVGIIATGSKYEAYSIIMDVYDWIGLNWHWKEFLTKPWTFLTANFTHFDFFHLLFNMLMFYWFASIVKEYIGQRHIMPIFFLGALSGDVIYIISMNLVDVLGPGIAPIEAIGASGGVLAMVLAAATIVPDLPIRVLLIGFVRLKYIALVLIALNILLLHDGNMGGRMAHLGGALFGFVYIRQLKIGHNWSVPFHNFLGFFAKPFRKKPTGPRVVYKRETNANRPTAEQSQRDQARIDSILDKINQSGYDSLTKEEKEFLFRYSNKD